METALKIIEINYSLKETITQVDRFCRWLIINRGIRETTIEGYRKVIKKFLIDLRTLTPTHEQIGDHIVYLHKKKYSYNHIVNSSIALEWYSQFIENPIKLGRPRKPKKIIQNTLTEAEMAIFLAATKNIRESAILSLLAFSGIRSRELCQFRVCDIDFGNNALRIIDGKMAKDRVICISGECTKKLLQYLQDYPRGQDSYLFTTLADDSQYTGWALRKLVKTVARRTKIAKHIHPHLFRHSLATNMLNRGANITTVQHQLGHAFIESTMIYVSSRFQRIQSEYQIFAPSYL